MYVVKRIKYQNTTAIMKIIQKNLTTVVTFLEETKTLRNRLPSLLVFIFLHLSLLFTRDLKPLPNIVPPIIPTDRYLRG